VVGVSFTWKDATSYSRDDRKREPTIWETHVSGVEVMVHRHIYNGPDTWLLSCRDVGIERRELRSKDIDAAKREAAKLLAKLLREKAARFVSAAKELDNNTAGGAGEAAK
jgi:hypothetical protein